MRKLFAGLVTLLELAVVAQFFLAASAAFDTAPKEESFAAHRSLAYGITLTAIVLTILAAVMRLPGRLIGMTGLIAALIGVQALIRAAAAAFSESGASTTAGTIIFGLHAINGLVILGLAVNAGRRARALARSNVDERSDGVSPAVATPGRSTP